MSDPKEFISVSTDVVAGLAEIASDLRKSKNPLVQKLGSHLEKTATSILNGVEKFASMGPELNKQKSEADRVYGPDGNVNESVQDMTYKDAGKKLIAAKELLKKAAEYQRRAESLVKGDDHLDVGQGNKPLGDNENSPYGGGTEPGPGNIGGGSGEAMIKETSTVSTVQKGSQESHKVSAEKLNKAFDIAFAKTTS